VKKYNFNDNFELLYLRHGYLSRVKNPEKLDVEKYFGISFITARKIYNKHKNIFEKVGFNQDDIVAIANVYTVSFVGLYSIEENKDKLDRIVQKYKDKFGKNTYPPEKEIERVNRNNLINFLLQKLRHCAVVCGRKSRNIFVGRDYKGYFADTENSRPASDCLIRENYKKYGYRKVTIKELKEVKEKAKANNIRDLYDKDGFRIFEINIVSGGVTKEDYEDIFNQNKGIYADPLIAMEHMETSREEESAMGKYKEIFNSMDCCEKYDKLSTFVKKYKKDEKYKEEIREARVRMRELKKINKV